MISYILFIVLIYFIFKVLSKPKYRITFIDPITKIKSYLLHINGSKKTFSTDERQNYALKAKTMNDAEKYIKFLGESNKPELEYFNGFYWKKYSGSKLEQKIQNKK